MKGRHSDNSTSRTINKKTIKKTIFEGNIPILKINIEYPEIDCDLLKGEKIYNDFYKRLTTNFQRYCEEKLSKQIARSSIRNENFRPFGEIMKYYITANGDNYISTLIEITHFDGYFKETLRYGHVWDIKNGVLLPYEYFFRKMKTNVKSVRREIAKIIYERIKEGGAEFNYTENRVKRYAGKVDPNNFFLVDGGIAFWFPVGTIAPESEGFPTYVVKTDCI